MQLRLEGFNVFNTLNLTNPVNDMAAGQLFGKSVSALPARSFQLAARVAF